MGGERACRRNAVERPEDFDRVSKNEILVSQHLLWFPNIYGHLPNFGRLVLGRIEAVFFFAKKYLFY